MEMVKVGTAFDQPVFVDRDQVSMVQPGYQGNGAYVHLKNTTMMTVVVESTEYVIDRLNGVPESGGGTDSGVALHDQWDGGPRTTYRRGAR